MLSMVRSRQQSRTASTAVETPAKRKRALTESRKKQNREAQQRFREYRHVGLDESKVLWVDVLMSQEIGGRQSIMLFLLYTCIPRWT